MSFGNKIAYTQSPGGVRRGLIWQSSNMGPSEDSRWLLCMPGPSTWSGANYGMKLPNNEVLESIPSYGIPTGVSTYRGMIGMPLDIIGRTAVAGPYPYTTQIDVDSDLNQFVSAFASEESYYIDLDFYVDPTMAKVGFPDNADGFDDPEFGQTSQIQYWEVKHGRNQIVNSGNPKNKGYFNRYTGEVYGVEGTSGYYSRLAGNRISYPSCPMRIQCRLVVTDYPFALSAYYTGGSYAPAGNFPVTIIEQYFDNLLDQYTVPADSAFVGSKIRSLESGSFYDDIAMPTFNTSYGDRIEGDGSGTTGISYRRTSGCFYTDLSKAFQMFLSPVLYPAVANLNGNPESAANDWYMLLPSKYYESTQIKLNQFKEHSTPNFIPPMISFPWIDYLQRVSGVMVPHFTSSYCINFINGNISYNDLSNPFAFNSYGLPDSGSGILMASGLRIGSSTATGSCILPPDATGRMVYPDLHFTDIFSGITSPQNKYYIRSYVQPLVEKNVKYITPFRASVTDCHTSRVGSGTEGYAVTGRFKYVGMKGKISLYETR